MKTLLALFTISAIGCSADWIAAVAQARTALNQRQYANAEQILTSAIDLIEAKSGRNATTLDEPLDLLSQAYRGEKRYADAATAQQRRIDIWAAILNENAVVVGRILGQLSMIDRQAGDLPGAEAHARRALAIMTAAFVDKPPVAQAAADLADVLLAENQQNEAEQMLATAQSMFESSLGPRSMLAVGIAIRRAAIMKQPAPDTSGIYHVGGQVAAPVIQRRIEPQYSEEARKKKLQGSVQISLVVDATGTPTQIAILRPLGLGLDEKAVKAVSTWKFAPATKNGTPVPVETQIEITFRLL